jgi:hypothetical protein
MGSGTRGCQAFSDIVDTPVLGRIHWSALPDGMGRICLPELPTEAT